MTELEGATKRDWLSSSFGTTKELLEDTSLDVRDGSNVLPWVPRTTAAVALRLQTFDAALFYDVEQKKQHSSGQIDTNQKVRLVSEERNNFFFCMYLMNTFFL